MMKKKTIIRIILSIVLLVILMLVFVCCKKYSNDKRYEMIKRELDEEATRYLKETHPYCTPGMGDFVITEETLLVQFAMDKSKLLDVDKKSYCKARIEVECVFENELDNNVYLKCKDYEDKNYSNWEERGKKDGRTDKFAKVSFNNKEQKIIDLINNILDINKYFITDNLESFEIINLQRFGYYESEKNILYVNVYYTSKCNDGTYKCDLLDNSKDINVEENIPFSFMIKVDVENYDYIEKINGFATHINSDWKNDLGRIE